MRDRDYLFYELTSSLCATCLRKVEAKVVIQDQNVFMLKRCPEHGFAKVLISTDAEYYKLTRRPIKHLMLNTNGLRIAHEPDFARLLKQYMPGFEIYLQFDSLRERPLRILRGVDLREVRSKALERLNEHNISTTLVVTLKKGVNDGEIGEMIDFALKQRCVRGVTFPAVHSVR